MTGEPPLVGSTRMSGNTATHVGMDGSTRNAGLDVYEQIYLGKKAAKQLGFGAAGWYDRNKTSTEAANRTAVINKNTEVRDGKADYKKTPNTQGSTYGGIIKTAAARAKANSALRKANGR